MDTVAIVAEILGGYALHPRGLHGVVHWARVMENGWKLAEITGADRDVAWPPPARRPRRGRSRYRQTSGFHVSDDHVPNDEVLDDAFVHRRCRGDVEA